MAGLASKSAIACLLWLALAAPALADAGEFLARVVATHGGGAAPAAFRGALVLQAARMGLAWRLQDNAQRVRDLGTRPDSAGKPARVLEWQVREDIRLIVEVDPETLLIRRSRGILSLNNSAMEFATGYENYRAVDGRQVAMTERHYAMGQFIGTTTLDSVEFPAVLPAPTFNPAAAGLSADAPHQAGGA